MEKFNIVVVRTHHAADAADRAFTPGVTLQRERAYGFGGGVSPIAPSPGDSPVLSDLR